MNGDVRHERQRILILLGTDVHPFARLCDWADQRATAHPEEDVLVQHGATAAPRTARGVEMLAPDELHRTLISMDAVVTHGGPGTIAAARAAGLAPLIIPRDPAHGEHVDDHQLRFARWASERGLGEVVLHVDLLDQALDAAAPHTRSTDENPQEQVAASTRRVLEELRVLRSHGASRRRLPSLKPPTWA